MNKEINNTKKSSTNFTNKIRSSLVLKLNVRMVLRLLAVFLSFNVLIVFVGLFVVFWNAEKEIESVIKIVETYPTEISYEDFGKYTVSDEIEEVNGIKIPMFIEQNLFKRNDWERSIYKLETSSNSKSIENLELIRYVVVVNINGKPYQIVYPLGNYLKIFLIFLIIILVFELITLIDEISKGARDIRKILKPIYDLTESAKNLNQEVSNVGIVDSKIKDLTGAISSIDVNKLYKRISIDTSQEELKELASAINNMLNRINESYQSQIRFVSDASHELRTPISVIQGYVNLLDRWGKKDEKTLQESIDAIKSETEHMKELVEKLLFLARGDNQTIQLYRENFDICPIAEEIVREAEMIDSTHDYSIEIKGPAFINGDKQLIKQAIRILVDNSIKFTPESGKIKIKISTDNDLVYVTVQDEGIGISPEDLPHIFDRFFRSDESRARKGGSGLGLSIAKWIIDRHGGHFEVLSRVNIGTRITIVLPKVDMEIHETIV